MDALDSNLWSAVLRREQLIEMLDGRGPRPVRDYDLNFLAHVGPRDLVGIWSSEDAESFSPLPQLLIGEADILEDLFAWSASYLRAFGPLTANMRVLTPTQLRSILNRQPPKEGWKIAGGAVGLVISEIIALGEGVSVDTAASSVPHSTVTFAIFRAWSLGFSIEYIDEIVKSYITLVQNTQRRANIHITRAAAIIGIALTGVHQGKLFDNRSQNWLSNLRDGADVYDIAAHVLRASQDMLISNDASQLRDMTAERRVQFFDSIAPSLARVERSENRLDTAFALALAAFVCRPGFEQQASLLREHAQTLPEAWLFLGALQAFTPIADVLAIGNGAGWRIAREIFRHESPWMSPKADAALPELNVLARGNSKALLRLMSKQRIDIEIHPMITVAIKGVPASSNQRQQDSDEDLDKKNALAAKQLSLVEARLEDALRAIRAMRVGDEEPVSSRSPRRRR